MGTLMKRIGWVGIVDNKPFFEDTHDGYVKLNDDPIPVTNIFKSKKEARKRFEAVAPVFINVVNF